MAKESPDKPAEKGMSTDLEKEKPQKPKPSAAGKKSARTTKTSAKTKTSPKTAKTRSTGKTGPTGEGTKSKLKSSPPKRQTAAAKAKKSSPRTTRKVETEINPLPAASTDPSGALPPTHEEPDTMNKMLFYGGGILALFVFLIVAASLQNMGKYEIIETNGVVEVWKGRFSPMGRDLMISMTGVEPPSQKKAVYTSEDVFPMVFQYYLRNSDALMTAAGSPGFEEIKSSLKQAGAFALTAEDRALIDSRLKAIDRTVLIYKADVSAAKGTAEGLQTARVYLQKAATLKPDEIEANLIQRKLESVQRLMKTLRPELAGKPSTNPVTKVAPPAPKTDDQKSSGSAPAPKTDGQEGPEPAPAPKTDGQQGSEPAPAEKSSTPMGGTT